MNDSIAENANCPAVGNFRYFILRLKACSQIQCKKSLIEFDQQEFVFRLYEVNMPHVCLMPLFEYITIEMCSLPKCRVCVP